MWSGIKEIININNKGSQGISITLIEDSTEIANKFNDYFSSVGTTVANSITAIDKSPLEYLNVSYQDCFFLSPVTKGEIEFEILKLNPFKSTGPCSMPIRNFIQLFIYNWYH